MDRNEFLNELCREGIIMYGVTWEENLKHIQKLKKYKDMWHWFKKNYSYYLVGVKEKQGNWTIKHFLDIAEQQYFPEEVEKELIRKRIKGLLEVVDELKRLLNV